MGRKPRNSGKNVKQAKKKNERGKRGNNNNTAQQQKVNQKPHEHPTDDSILQNGSVEAPDVNEPSPVTQKKSKNKPRKAREYAREVITLEDLGLVAKPGMTKAQVREKKRCAIERQRKKDELAENDMDVDEDDGNAGVDEDFSDTANEREKEYRLGGYHPVVVGDMYNDRYRIVRKLGWGYFSTVWLVWDYTNESFQALKIQKAAESYRDAAFDEIKLLDEIMAADPDDQMCCARMTDHFEHPGPHGVHVCMVFDVLGENLLSLMERYQHRGIPLPIVKSIARQVLIGLSHIHSLAIIHTDLKPENVLLSTPKHKIIREMQKYKVPPISERLKLTERNPKYMTKSQKRRYLKMMAEKKKTGENDNEGCNGKDAVDKEKDDGSSINVKSDKKKDGKRKEGEDESGSETDQEWEIHRFHSVSLADFGNSCHVDNQFTDEVQTRQYRAPEVIVGNGYSLPIDMWSCACMIFELLTGEFLYDPKQADDYSRDEDHLALMTELNGGMPDFITKDDGTFRHQFYDSRGNLRHIHNLHYITLESVLHSRHKFTVKKSKEIAEFLAPMMEVCPNRRATALEMLDTCQGFFEVNDDDYNAREVKDDSDEESRYDDSADGDDEGDSDDHLEYSSEEEEDEEIDEDEEESEEDKRERNQRDTLDYISKHPFLHPDKLAEKGLTFDDIKKGLANDPLEEDKVTAVRGIIEQLQSDCHSGSEINRGRR